MNINLKQKEIITAMKRGYGFKQLLSLFEINEQDLVDIFKDDFSSLNEIQRRYKVELTKKEKIDKTEKGVDYADTIVYEGKKKDRRKSKRYAE